MENNYSKNLVPREKIIRFASINSSNINKELCLLAAMNGMTKGTNIFLQVQEFTIFNNLDTLDFKSKLFSILADGAKNFIFLMKFILLILNCFKIYPLPTDLAKIFLRDGVGEAA